MLQKSETWHENQMSNFWINKTFSLLFMQTLQPEWNQTSAKCTSYLAKWLEANTVSIASRIDGSQRRWKTDDTKIQRIRTNSSFVQGSSRSKGTLLRIQTECHGRQSCSAKKTCRHQIHTGHQDIQRQVRWCWRENRIQMRKEKICIQLSLKRSYQYTRKTSK